MSAAYPQVHDPINQTTRIEDAISYDGLKPVIHNAEERTNGSKAQTRSTSRSKRAMNHHDSQNGSPEGTPRNSNGSGGIFKAMLDRALYAVNSSSKYVMEKSYSVYIALQNPVVLTNALIGAASMYAMMTKYIKNENRFLADKSNSYIWGTAVAAVGLLSLDVMLSKRYYMKFQKKLGDK